MDEEIRRGKYQHYKGNFYFVIDTAKHTETKEELVLYRSQDDLILWARPKRMFLENVVVNGKEVPRFRFISYS